MKDTQLKNCNKKLSKGERLKWKLNSNNSTLFCLHKEDGKMLSFNKNDYKSKNLLIP